MANDLQDLGSITDILLTQPNWGVIPRLGMDFSRKIFSSPGTAMLIQSWIEDAPHILEYSYSFFNKQEEFALLDWFNDHKAQVNPFWLVGYAAFFTLSQAATIGSPVMYVKDNEFDNIFKGYERIAIRMINGDILTRKIVSVAVGPGADELTLQLNTNLDRNIPLTAEVFRLYMARYAIDSLQMDYRSISAGKTDVRFIELIHEYPS